jgi:hypothetical protein
MLTATHDNGERKIEKKFQIKAKAIQTEMQRETGDKTYLRIEERQIATTRFERVWLMSWTEKPRPHIKLRRRKSEFSEGHHAHFFTLHSLIGSIGAVKLKLEKSI